MFGLERTGAIQSALQVKYADADSAKKSHAHKSSSKDNIQRIRVLQREGKILVGEDFTPLDKGPFMQRAASAIGPRTKSALMARRREQNVSELQAAYGDL